MKPVIEKRDSFKIVGLKRDFTAFNGENFKEIPEFWAEAWKYGLQNKLCPLMDTDIKGILGVCTPGKDKHFSYFIAAATTKNADGLEEYTIPASTWARFKCTGPLPGAIQNTCKRIMTEWLPNAEYKHAGTAELEVYSEGDTASENYKSEVWIPVVKKA